MGEEVAVSLARNDKMALDCTVGCLKMEINVEKMLLPYHEQDSSCLHVIKVRGDA